jgi:hypothetical protein
MPVRHLQSEAAEIAILLDDPTQAARRQQQHAGVRRAQ